MTKRTDKDLHTHTLAGPVIARRNVLAWLLPSALVPGVVACSSGPQLTGNQNTLEERARAYWAATVSNDLVAAWPLENVSLDPKWTLQAYLKRGGINYEAAEVKGVKSQDGDHVVLDVEIRFSLPQLRLKNQVSVIADRWSRVDGVWYHVLGRNSIFDQPK